MYYWVMEINRTDRRHYIETSDTTELDRHNREKAMSHELADFFGHDEQAEDALDHASDAAAEAAWNEGN